MSITIKTVDIDISNIEIKYLEQSDLLTKLLEMMHDGTIRITVSFDHFQKIYEFLKYTYDKPPIIENITYPCVYPLSIYLHDIWYDKWLTGDVIWWQSFYNSCDYLQIWSLCKIVVAHIGYLINAEIANCNDVKLPEPVRDTETFYNINTNRFEQMNEDMVDEYLSGEIEKWNISNKNENFYNYKKP